MACPGRTLYVAVNGLAEDDVRVLEGCSQPELHYSRWGTANARATEPAEELSEEEVLREPQRRPKRIGRSVAV